MYATPSWIPSQMDEAVSSIENIYVKVSWDAPQANGAEITAYKVLVLASDNLSWLESDNCHSTDPLLVLNLYCYLPMEDITDPAKFGLAYNTFISVKVQALNLRGWSDLSPINTLGVNAEVVPVKMNQPSNGGETFTTETEIHVVWDALVTQSEMGGATCSILSYNLEWDRGDVSPWEELTGIYTIY